MLRQKSFLVTIVTYYLKISLLTTIFLTTNMVMKYKQDQTNNRKYKATLRIGNDNTEAVDSFCLLGSMINSKGTNNKKYITDEY